MWEAMAMNSWPIIISDHLKLPSKISLQNKNWHRISEEINVTSIDLPPYNNREYWDWFSNDNLYKSITLVLN